MTLNVANANAILKEYYTDAVIQQLLYKKNALFELIAKKSDPNFGGLPYFRNPVSYSPGPQPGNSFAVAQKRALAGSQALADFQVPRQKFYQFQYFDDDLLDAAASKGKTAFIDAMQLGMDGMMNSERRELGITIFGDGWGMRGQISPTGFSNVGTTITLVDPKTAKNFEIGYSIEVTDAKGNARRALGSSGNGLIITKVNTSTGVLTFGNALNDATNGIPAIAASDFIALEGDIATSRGKYLGLAAWIPDTDPASNDSFCNVNRSISPTRLAGVRIDGTSMDPGDAGINGIALVSQEGANPDTLVVSYNTYQTLSKTYQSTKRGNTNEGGKAVVGYSSFVFDGPDGNAVKVLLDLNCPDNRMYVLQSDTWAFKTLGSVKGETVKKDGLTLIRNMTDDNYEMRRKWRGSLVCSAPGLNGVISIAS